MTPEKLEQLAHEVHKVYCTQYEKNHGKPYWTGGDYSKLDEQTKDYDRALVTWHLSALDAQSAEIETLKAEKERLKKEVEGIIVDRVQPCGCVLCRCDTDDRCFGCGAKMCDDKDCNVRKGMRTYSQHPLRTRLSAIEKAAREVKAKQRAFYDHPSLAGLTLMRMEDEINTAIDALAALLEKGGRR